MSSNAPTPSTTASTAPHAIDVGFSSVRRRNGESSSQAESRRSSGKRSSSSQKRESKATPQDEDSPRAELSRSTGSIGRGPRVRSSGGFLLESPFANGSPPASTERHGKRKMQDAPLRVDKRRVAPARLSTESSHRGSPLSREVSMNVDGPAPARDETATSRTPSADAAQLVQMALNLSETRKRHVSNSLRVPSGGERRVISMPMSNVGTLRAVSGPRQQSSDFSGTLFNAFPPSSSNQDGDSDERNPTVPDGGDLDDRIFYTFTPATLARAEKARKYFELASEYRRLLETLPPLRPDVSPSSGRPYNPIQSLRNRRIRIREKRPFPAPPESWVDPEKVDGWITDVESTVKYSDYDTSDESVTLPHFEGEDEATRPESRQFPPGARHKRTDTSGSVITRPENSWTIEPTELLADAYWTEKDDNKAFIETRRGEPIFPSLQRPRASTPKISIDLHHERVEDHQQNGNVHDYEEPGRPSRRRKLLLPLSTGADHRRRPGRLLKRTSFSSDESSHERHISGVLSKNGSIENIGPLERHMQKLIAKDERGELSSPEMISPDRWNPMFKPPAAQRGSIERLRRDSSASRGNTRASLEVPRDFHRRSQSADGRVGSFDRPVIPVEDDDIGSDPDSPVRERRMPSIGMDLSPPLDTRRSLDESRFSKGLNLPSFHSLNKDINNIEESDFAEGRGKNLSPILSASLQSPSETSTPPDLRRQGTSDSWMPLRRLDTASTLNSSKEGSTVGRFLRHRRERKVKNRERIDGGETSAGVTDVSEAEDNAVAPELLRKNTMDDDSDASLRKSSDRARPKPKFHLGNLPAFTSSSRDKRLQLESPKSAKDDPFGNQSRRPRRFNRPLSTLTQGGVSNAELANDSEKSSLRARKGYGQLQPLFAEIAWHPTAGPGGFSPSVTQSKRHWSIYDKLQPAQNDKITAKDIARVRALLLSSGIKAREIQRRADEPRSKPSASLSSAAKTAHQTPEPVALKDEELAAAQLLSTYLTTSLSQFESTVASFQNHTVRGLGSTLEDLRQRATDRLSKLAHDTSDEADAFAMELNTKTPQQTKRVDDAVDEMLRRRRRQFRLFRIVGFKLLEWAVLGILWWIWFLVVVFNTGRRMIVGAWRILYWLFTW